MNTESHKQHAATNEATVIPLMHANSNQPDAPVYGVRLTSKEINDLEVFDKHHNPLFPAMSKIRPALNSYFVAVAFANEAKSPLSKMRAEINVSDSARAIANVAHNIVASKKYDDIPIVPKDAIDRKRHAEESSSTALAIQTEKVVGDLLSLEQDIRGRLKTSNQGLRSWVESLATADSADHHR